ncbi:hypothetical protein [Rhodococcus chondri]|uniref:Uncharacterized protein n=1 Tax=Rhodococcus chondri TaxID=3065941 RepID=A0ABU7JPN2_9NOCA|nr:hypothetical protein [Rhodococcus sp. CC-R104]MEE2031702.1 hypothetical protein [Rhodococcus sp. CC-R104]
MSETLNSATRSPRACHSDDKVRDYLDRGWWQPETMLDLFDAWVARRADSAATTDPANLVDLTVQNRIR